MKSKTFFAILLLMFILTSCIARQEERPQRRENEIWVCQELEDTYFYWDKDRDIFYGNIAYAEETYEFFLSGSSGLVLSFVAMDGLKEEALDVERYEIFSGVADYQNGFFPFKIEEDPHNIFKGEIADITFVCCDREEYFKSRNIENAE